MIKLQKRRTHLLVLTVMILSLSTGNVVKANEYHIKPMKQNFNKQFQYKPKNIFQKLAYQSIQNRFKEQNEIELKKIKNEENIKYWQWKNEQIKQEQLKKQQEEQNQWVTVRISYYTNSYSNCGKIDQIGANNKRIELGDCAAPSCFKYNTVFQLEDGSKLRVMDRGSAIAIKNNIIWLDVFIPNASEEYLDKLGVRYLKAKIIK